MPFGQYSPSIVLVIFPHLHSTFSTLQTKVETGGCGVKRLAVSMRGDSAGALLPRSTTIADSPIASRINTRLHTRLGARIVGDGGSHHPR
jgi:hypothetical protein